jgi:hypothetical protein
VNAAVWAAHAADAVRIGLLFMADAITAASVLTPSLHTTSMTRGDWRGLRGAVLAVAGLLLRRLTGKCQMDYHAAFSQVSGSAPSCTWSTMGHIITCLSSNEHRHRRLAGQQEFTMSLRCSC